MNAIERAILDVTARAESLKKYYGLYTAETDPEVKAALKDICQKITAGIRAESEIFLTEIKKE